VELIIFFAHNLKNNHYIKKSFIQNIFETQNVNVFEVFYLKIGALFLHENVIKNQKISPFPPLNFRKIFVFWFITQNIIKISKNVSNKIPFPSTFHAFYTYDILGLEHKLYLEKC